MERGNVQDVHANDINASGEILGTGTFTDGVKDPYFGFTELWGYVLAPFKVWDVLSAFGPDEATRAQRFIMLLGGAPYGAAGTGITVGGKPIPIDPHGPAKELAAGHLLQDMAKRIRDPSMRKTIEETAATLIHDATKRIGGP